MERVLVVRSYGKGTSSEELWKYFNSLNAELNSICHLLALLGAHHILCGPGSSVGTATELRAGRSEDRIPVEARFSAPVQTGLGAHPASYTMGTGSFPGVESGRNVTLTPSPPSSAEV
jgi:hypothetical protein